jgi:hypothetical protein
MLSDCSFQLNSVPSHFATHDGEEGGLRHCQPNTPTVSRRRPSKLPKLPRMTDSKAFSPWVTRHLEFKRQADNNTNAGSAGNT